MKGKTKYVVKKSAAEVGKYVGSLLKLVIVIPIVIMGSVITLLLQITCAVAFALLGDYESLNDVLNKIKCNF